MYRNKYQKLLVIFGAIVIWMLTISFASVASAQRLNIISEKGEIHPKLESVLTELQEENEKGVVTAQEFVLKRDIKVKDQDRVTVFLISEIGKTTDVIDKKLLRAYGAEIIKSADNVLKAEVPINRLKQIADNVNGISYIRLPDRPSPLFQSEGVSLTGASSYQSGGYTGSGVKIAVIDLGFDGLSSAISSGDLPSDIVKVDCTGSSCVSTTFPSEASEHGTGVAEIVYDMAAGAQLYLIKIDDLLDLKDAKDYCINNGIKIINHSVGWNNTNFYSGECYNVNPVCTADDAYSNGILWINAAGNAADKHYEGTFTDADGDGWHNVSGSSEVIEIPAKAGDNIKVYLTWNAWPTTSQDYDFYLYNSSLSKVLASSKNPQTGTQPPTESISYSVASTDTYYLTIRKYSAISNHQLEVYSANHDLTPAVASSSFLSPADASGVMAVAAIYYGYWAAGPQESFSSQGPTNDGRTKPEISGPDGVSNYTYTSFFGTSASSPHVAGAAALILSNNPSYSVSQLWSALTGSAIDMGSSGQDNIYGYGRLNLPEITPSNNPPNTPSNPSPADGATDVPVTTSLSWSGGDPDAGNAVTYNVYWDGQGNNPDPPLWASNQTNASVDVSPLRNYSTTYYWKILARDNHGDETTGPVWSFTTTSKTNQPPLLNSIGNKTVAEGQTLSFTISGADPDGDSLSYSASNLPSGASFSGQTFSWTPSYDQAGTYTGVHFEASDGSATDSEDITITVTNINRTPTADAQSVTTAEDTQVNITLSGSDPDGDSLSYIVVTQPAHGTLSGTAPNLSYTPEANFNGTDSFTFKVNDSQADSVEATVSITVSPVNDAPDIPSNPSLEDGATGVSIIPILNWSGGDPDSGDTVTYDVYFDTSGATTKVSSGQSVTVYIPDTLSYATTYYWKVVAKDNNGAETEGDVWSFTTKPNTPPIANAGPDQIIITDPIGVILDGKKSYDPDDPSKLLDSFRWSFVSTPDGSETEILYPESSMCGFYPDIDGTYIIQLIVNDGLSDSAPDTVKITALGLNQHVEISTNQTSYTSGETLELFLCLGNSKANPDITGDIFLGFVMPDNSLLLFDSSLSKLVAADPNDLSTFTPSRENVTIPFGYVSPVPGEANADMDNDGVNEVFRFFSAQLPALKEGTYYAFAALAKPGSYKTGIKEIIGDISIVQFSFSP